MDWYDDSWDKDHKRVKSKWPAKGRSLRHTMAGGQAAGRWVNKRWEEELSISLLHHLHRSALTSTQLRQITKEEERHWKDIGANTITDYQFDSHH